MISLSHSRRAAGRKALPPTPADRYLAHRRRSFVRDWILALIAFRLCIAASAIRFDPPATAAVQSPYAGVAR